MMYRFMKAINPMQLLLCLASIVLSVILIGLHNAGILPIALGDFIFFSGLIFLCALYRPGMVFLFFIGLLPLEIIDIAPHELGISLRPYQWIGMLVFAATIIRYMVGRLPYALPQMYRVEWLLVCIWIGSVLAAVQGIDKGTGMKQALILGSFLMLYALSRIFIRTLTDVKNVLTFVIGSSVVVSLYAIWQNIRFMHQSMSFQVMAGRPNSVFAEADWLGMYLLVIIGTVYALLLVLQKSKRGELDIFKLIGISISFRLTIRQVVNVFVNLALLLLIIVLILTVARSAWLGVGLMMGIFSLYLLYDDGVLPLWNSSRKQAFSLVSRVGVIVLAGLWIIHITALTPFDLLNRAQSTASGLQEITVACDDAIELPATISTVDSLATYHCRHIFLEERENEERNGMIIQTVMRPDPNIDIREQIYRKSWDTLRVHWLFGIGLGNSSAFLGTDGRGAGLNASNIFLETWLGAGLLGFTAFVVLWLHIGWYIWRRVWRMKLHTEWLAVFLSLGTVWVGLSVFNMFNSGLLLGFFWVWLAVAAHFSQRKIQPEEVLSHQTYS